MSATKPVEPDFLWNSLLHGSWDNKQRIV